MFVFQQNSANVTLKYLTTEKLLLGSIIPVAADGLPVRTAVCHEFLYEEDSRSEFKFDNKFFLVAQN